MCNCVYYPHMKLLYNYQYIDATRTANSVSITSPALLPITSGPPQPVKKI